MLAAQSSNPSHVPVNTTCHVQQGGRPRAVSTGSAMASEDISAITLLLSHNASLTATDHFGNTALHHASAWGNLKAVRTLLSAGAPPLALNKANYTPLDYSVTKQAVQYFQSIVNELENRKAGDRLPPPPSQDQPQLQPKALKINTTAARTIVTPPEETRPGCGGGNNNNNRRLGSPMSSPVKGRHQEQQQSINNMSSPLSTNHGGLRLVIDTESPDLAGLDDNVPSTAKRIERSPVEGPRMVPS